MARAKDADRQRIAATAKVRTEIDFELDAEQQKAVADCIKRNGRLQIRIEPAGTTALPSDAVSGIVVID